MNEIEELKLEIIRLKLVISKLERRIPKKRDLNRLDVLNFIKSVGTVDRSTLLRRFQCVNAFTLDKALSDLSGCRDIITRKVSGKGRIKTTYSST